MCPSNSYWLALRWFKWNLPDLARYRMIYLGDMGWSVKFELQTVSTLAVWVRANHWVEPTYTTAFHSYLKRRGECTLTRGSSRLSMAMSSRVQQIERRSREPQCPPWGDNGCRKQRAVPATGYSEHAMALNKESSSLKLAENIFLELWWSCSWKEQPWCLSRNLA